MQKTKLGIPVGMVGAAIFFVALFSGYLATILLTAYVLWFEENAWLRKSALKAITLLISFSLLIALFNLIPNAISVINNVVVIFGGSFSITVLSRIVSAIVTILEFIEKILFIILGIKALNQGTITIPVVDKLIEKYAG